MVIGHPGHLDDVASRARRRPRPACRGARRRRARRRARWRRISADPSRSEKYATCARTRRATAATSGSSALRTTQPSGLVIRQIVDLTSASSGSVWMPCRSRWSDETLVRTLDLVRLIADAAQHDPAARGLEDGDVDVAAGQDLVRPAGPVQSPGSTIRSSTRTPSEVVVPTWRPAPIRMCVMSRVTVLLPFVPEIDTIGTRRSASRIHDGGVVPASAIRSVQRASSRSCAPVRWAVRDGETSRSERARAASAIVRARSAPRHGKVTIQCPGSDERWTAARRSPRRGRSAAAGATRRAHRSRRASPAAGRARRAGRGRGARGRAGRTRSAAGRSATSSLTTGSSR